MEPSLTELKAGIQRACQPTYVPHIVEGRTQVEKMPRAWVFEKILPLANEVLNLSDDWEYRRLLELLDLLGARDALRIFVESGLASDDEYVREAAEDFREKT